MGSPLLHDQFDISFIKIRPLEVFLIFFYCRKKIKISLANPCSKKIEISTALCSMSVNRHTF